MGSTIGGFIEPMGLFTSGSSLFSAADLQALVGAPQAPGGVLQGPFPQPPVITPPSGVSAAVWNAILDAIRVVEGVSSYGVCGAGFNYGDPTYCGVLRAQYGSPSQVPESVGRSLASQNLNFLYQQYGNLKDALTHYGTGSAYATQVINIAQVNLAGAGGVGNELSTGVANPAITTSSTAGGGVNTGIQSNAQTAAQATTGALSGLGFPSASSALLTIVIIVIGIILVALAANAIAKG